MVLGAVVLVGADDNPSVALQRIDGDSPMATDSPLECLELLGRSMLDRAIERFVNANAAVVTVLVNSACPFRTSHPPRGHVKFRVAEDPWLAAVEALKEYSDNGIENAVLVKASSYVECDIGNLLEYHCGNGRTVTGTRDSIGALGLWVADCKKVQREPLASLLSPQNHDLPSYFVWNYSNRLEQPSDLRRLVADAFRGTCAMRPSGSEIRPGVFVEDGVQIHKRARIVAPAFVGRDSKIGEDTLVTRCSNIESGCYIDCGTVVEDSSILSNTYVGICLDISHCIVQGNTLLHVGRNVEVKIADGSVVRENVPLTKPTAPEALVTLSQKAFGAVLPEFSTD